MEIQQDGDSELAQLSNEFNGILGKIGENLSNHNKKFESQSLIQNAFCCAEKTRDRAIEILSSGGVVRKVGGKNKETLIPHMNSDDIYELYYHWINQVQQYADKLRVLHGQATPIPHSGGLAGPRLKKENAIP